ncbi:Pet191p ASCRUDRAFT_77846 [Ascoidea rubescens DSM 1968]|uniref:Cytochrome c oxidase assembly protein PET191 n=1 Tax=Ascoidea rubescens DSM 1968 TaxID=1344418 RepID=A0A1D2VAG8_9ASCO|nr:hypothetical protein ASCRUDRAFT_77846 [Ascoidea rubescens DSM 1968]ODV58611.1 hypothetical protein ASCRUDRAFT_77846 [Ascoidea rubescens DSM 1968]
MPSSCKDQRYKMAICLQRSPCVLIERHTPKECVQNQELLKTLPSICLAQMKEFMDCKRGIIDKSKRFTGNGPLSSGKYDEHFENFSKGNLDPVEEYHKLKYLEKLNSGESTLTKSTERSLQP